MAIPIPRCWLATAGMPELIEVQRKILTKRRACAKHHQRLGGTLLQAIIRVRARIVPDFAHIGDIGFDATELHRLIWSGRRTQAAAFQLLVHDGMIHAEHCFRGLNRPYRDPESGLAGNGDRFLVYTYRLPYDVVFDHASGATRITAPPPGAVFMVIVAPASDLDRAEYGIHGWIRAWNWVIEEGTLKGAPIDPGTRFAERLWSATMAG